MGPILGKLLESIISKKKVIGFVAAIAIAALAVPLGMGSEELKEAICGAPSVEVKVAPTPDPELVEALENGK